MTSGWLSLLIGVACGALLAVACVVACVLDEWRRDR